jgi:high affinity sulfate transporter 1
VVALRSYQRSWLRPDLIAGLTVGAMLIPQSMAYAELAGLAPQYGFYAVIGALVVYALVGTSRHLGVGPEPGTAILAATGVGAIAGGDPDRYVMLMATLALVVAAIAIVGAVLRLGFVASALSKPVLVGYITGVGLTLLSSQIAPFTGIPIEADRFGPRVVELVRDLDQIDWPTFTVGAATLGVLLVMRRVAPSWPGALLGVAGATAAVALLGLADDVAVVGAIPGGLAVPQVPAASLEDLRLLLPVALGIALVGYTDNVLTARSIAARQGYRIDPNQEMLALGLTNLTAGLSQGFPVSSSASRTAVPASIGSRSQLVSVVAAAFVVVALVGARPLLEEIPRSALAAVIITAAIAIIDIDGYRSLWRVSRVEAGLAAMAAIGVVAFDVLVGVIVAVALSVLVALYRIARPHDAVLGDLPDLDGWVELDAYPEATPEPGLLVYRFDAPLFFVNANRFADRVEEAMADNPGDEEWVVLDFEGIGAIDATALDAVAELLERLAGLGVEVVAVARANDEVCERLRRAQLAEPEGPLRLHATINGAVRAYRMRHEPEGPAITDRR